MKKEGTRQVRITQSMLSTNMLRNLNTSYGKMSSLQNQINSGSKISRASDDPVVAVKGMGYRTELNKIEQFARNVGEAHTWVDTTDSALNDVGSALLRVQELVTQAANDTNTADDRQKIEIEIDQIRGQIRDLANSQVAGKYLFSGTNTSKPLFADSTSPINTLTGATEERRIEVYDGIYMPVNSTNGTALFSSIDSTLANLTSTLKDPTKGGDEIGSFLTHIQKEVDNVLLERAEAGAKQNRLDMMENRLSGQEILITKQMSENEDTDYAKAISDMTIAEPIHSAALSVGSKIVQQTLVDFMR